MTSEECSVMSEFAFWSGHFCSVQNGQTDMHKSIGMQYWCWTSQSWVMCNFRFTPNAITPTIRQLNQSHFLVINITSLSLHCPTGPQEIPACHYCILRIPCNCSISSPEFFLSERFTGCHDSHLTTTVMHPVNLILLHKFFGPSVNSHIMANSTFSAPLNISIKPFKLFNHKFQNTVGNDEKNTLKLRYTRQKR